MIIVKLMGGMGNQMFQYAFGRFLALKYETELGLDLTFLLNRTPKKDMVFRNFDLDVFAIASTVVPSESVQKYYSPWFKVLRRFGINGVASFYSERRFGPYCPEIASAPDGSYLDGYWQSQKYFEPIQEQIRKDFNLVSPVSEMVQELITQIEDNAYSVCLNVRRSDFVGHKLHDICGVDYYHQAMERMNEHLSNPKYYVFSDDINWCKQHLRMPNGTLFVDHSYKGDRFSSYLYLMAACKNFVIPNSSFAWWAVWLSQHEQKIVISPKHWFNDASLETYDLIPEDWIRV